MIGGGFERVFFFCKKQTPMARRRPHHRRRTRRRFRRRGFRISTKSKFNAPTHSGRGFGRQLGTFARSSRRRLVANIGPAIMPPKAMVTFKTCAYVELPTDASAGVTEDNVFSINSPINSFGSTNEPMGWTQWFGFYNKGRVISCDLKVVYQGSQSRDLVMGLIPEAGDGASAGPTAFADTIPWTEWCAYPRAQNRTLMEVDVGGNRSSVTMRYHCKPNKFFNESYKGNDNFDFTISTVPKNIVGMHFIYGAFDTGTVLANSALNATMKVEIRWHCLMYDRKNLAITTS